MKLHDFEDFLNEGKSKLPFNSHQITFLNMFVEKGKWSENPDGTVDVNGNFYCINTHIDNFPVKLNVVKGDFVCKYCMRIRSLKNSPNEVGGDVIIVGCPQLQTVSNGPKKIGGEVIIDDCKALIPTERLIAKNGPLVKLWLQSQLPLKEFLKKRRGQVKGHKFGI